MELGYVEYILSYVCAEISVVSQYALAYVLDT